MAEDSRPNHASGTETVRPSLEFAVTMFERTPLDQLLAQVMTEGAEHDDANQLKLFE